MRYANKNVLGAVRAAALCLLSLLAASCGDDGATNTKGDGGGCGDDAAACECADAGCASGECMDGMCVDCVRGEQGCACRSNGTCAAGGSCRSEVCVACVAGAEGCPCDRGSCGEGLSCMSGKCAAASCAPGDLGCPCRGAGEACASGASCVEGTCAACTNDTPGCPCENGTCSGGLICDADTCRVPRSCADLVADGECPSTDACVESSRGHDAMCKGGGCSGDGGCACDGGACGSVATCVAGVEGSILDQCSRQYRACVEEDQGASCGGCLSGEAEVNDECPVDTSCGGVECEDTEYCDRSDPEQPACVARPCPVGQAADVSNGGSCATCTRSCGYPGATGDLWPFTDKAGNCLCDTLPGFFNAGGATSAPKLCDADGDGWVNDFLRDPNIVGGSRDQALADTARCRVRMVQSVVLVDEYGVQLELHSCKAGLQAAACADDADIEPIRLLESKRNDTPGDPENSGSIATPAVGPSGRKLRANELTALTKVCAAELGDFDDDGVEDIDEVQNHEPGGERERLASFAHFIELYSSHYEPPASGPYGKLVIAERNRCSAATFPLTVSATDTGYDASSGASYWRSCYRNRDASYTESSSDPGNDFAQWTCSATSGSCPAAPPASASVNASTPLDPATDPLLRDFGLCELGASPPADGVFRGMGHGSEFRCVRIVKSASTSPRDRQAVQSFNQCSAEAGSTGSGVGPREPELRCEVVSQPDKGTVGWEIAPFQSYREIGSDGQPMNDASYTRGCVTEDAEWPYLCRYPSFRGLDPNVANDAAILNDTFGRYRCAGWTASFLWAPDDGELAFDQLAWAPDDADAANMSVWAPGAGQ